MSRSASAATRRALGDVIELSPRSWAGSSPLAQSDLLAPWAEIAGAETAEALRRRSASTSGVLTVQCESTAWATQLRLMRVEIMTRIVDAVPRRRHRVDPLSGAQRPLLEKGPQIDSRAWSARYLRLDRQIRSLARNNRLRSAISAAVGDPPFGRMEGRLN